MPQHRVPHGHKAQEAAARPYRGIALAPLAVCVDFYTLRQLKMLQRRSIFLENIRERQKEAAIAT